MKLFSEEKELVEYAGKLVHERIKSLEGDVQHCLAGHAVFPALLYCFATVDLLGALLAGDASRNANTSKQAKEYMGTFMNYSSEQIRLLQASFRHKLVHLAVPRPVVEDQGRQISWHVEYQQPGKHLHVEELSPADIRQETTKLCLGWDHRFCVSVLDLVREIKSSADTYLDVLAHSAALQGKFECAISQMYDYSQ